MRSFVLALCTVALIGPAATARGQAVAARVDRVRDGSVRMSFATRDNVCGDGQFIGVDRADAFWMYSSWENGFSTNVLRDVRPECTAGPLRLVVVKEGGIITELRAAVGVAWRQSETATDLGMVSAPDAAAWLIGLTETASDRVARVAFLAASVADSARVTGRVLEVAQNRKLSDEVRERAIRWLGDIALAEGRGAEADRALKAMASDGNEVVTLRERAIRSLGTSPANRAYLRSLYSRISEESLKERILRELGRRATAEDAAWVRDVALDAREATALRERAVRVLGDELGRSGDVRDLYAKLDRAALKERALRVVAEHDDAGAMGWLRQVAEDQNEVMSLRDRAIRLLAERDQLTYLRQIYPRLDRAELRERVLRSAAESGTPEAAAWLTTIVLDHTERSDLRERAVRELADGHASSADLGDLYDGVDVSTLKQRLVRLLAERGDDVAVKKLTSIAERDRDPNMRREASRRLGERTRNP